MKLIIAGGRDVHLKSWHFTKLDTIEGVTEVVSGGASGVDWDGERWAERRDIVVKRFIADWGQHGKAAGPIRNQQMADYADALAVFAGGRGTADMVRRAQARGLQIFDFRK